MKLLRPIRRSGLPAHPSGAGSANVSDSLRVPYSVDFRVKAPG
jgi:hypothetical protein